jgi:hypothetical protein
VNVRTHSADEAAQINGFASDEGWSGSCSLSEHGDDDEHPRQRDRAAAVPGQIATLTGGRSSGAERHSARRCRAGQIATSLHGDRGAALATTAARLTAARPLRMDLDEDLTLPSSGCCGHELGDGRAGAGATGPRARPRWAAPGARESDLCWHMTPVALLDVNANQACLGLSA